MRKNPHTRILKGKLKEQHLSIVPKSCPYIYIYIYNFLEVLLLFIYFEIQKIRGKISKYTHIIFYRIHTYYVTKKNHF